MLCIFIVSIFHIGNGFYLKIDEGFYNYPTHLLDMQEGMKFKQDKAATKDLQKAIVCKKSYFLICMIIKLCRFISRNISYYYGYDCDSRARTC